MKSLKFQTFRAVLKNPEPFNWLSGRSFSEAFVICIGAGPWKFGRRKTIQGMALEKLNSQDISDLHNIDWYPLAWQNKFINSLASYLRKHDVTMEEFCKNLQDRKVFYAACGCPKGSKVLSLFCRDVLSIDSFPIDRHVKRLLEQHGLPSKEDDMITMCKLHNQSPAAIAIACVRTASNMDNPDWSV